MTSPLAVQSTITASQLLRYSREKRNHAIGLNPDGSGKSLYVGRGTSGAGPEVGTLRLVTAMLFPCMVRGMTDVVPSDLLGDDPGKGTVCGFFLLFDRHAGSRGRNQGDFIRGIAETGIVQPGDCVLQVVSRYACLSERVMDL